VGEPFRETLPPVLLGAESDVAASLGIALEADSRAQLGSVVTALVLINAGMLVSELVRKRYALRIGGVIVPTPRLERSNARSGPLVRERAATERRSVGGWRPRPGATPPTAAKSRM